LNRSFRKAYEDRYGFAPRSPAYKMAQAILGVKAAWEKAQGGAGKRPDQEQVIAAFEHLSFDAPGGTVEMSLGKGHQAIQGTAYGMAKTIGGKVTMVDVKTYPQAKVTPPDGVKSEDWIKSDFKSGK